MPDTHDISPMPPTAPEGLQPSYDFLCDSEALHLSRLKKVGRAGIVVAVAGSISLGVIASSHEKPHELSRGPLATPSSSDFETKPVTGTPFDEIEHAIRRKKIAVEENEVARIGALAIACQLGQQQRQNYVIRIQSSPSGALTYEGQWSSARNQRLMCSVM